MRICSNCGAGVSDDTALYCPSCGAALSAQPAANAAPAGTPNTAPGAPAPAAPDAGVSAPGTGPAQPGAQPNPQSGVGAQPNPQPGAGPQAAPAFGGPVPLYGAPQQPPFGAPYGMPPRQPAGPMPGMPDESALCASGYNAFIDALASPRMQLLCILISASLLLSVVSSALGGSSLGGILGGLALGALSTAAMWWMYASARGTQQGGTFNEGGLKMYRVLLYVSCILLWVVCGGALLVIGFASSAMGPELIYRVLQETGLSLSYLSSLSGILSALMALAALVMVAVIVLTIFTFIKMKHTLNAMLCTARTGLPTAFVSRFLIVLFYIGGAGEVIGALASVDNVLSTNSGRAAVLAAALGELVSAAYQFLLANGMQQYRKQTEAIWRSAGVAPYMR